MSFENIKKSVGDYYTGKINEHGASPRGVDWNSEESQFMRFGQLLKVIQEPTQPFSLLDYGCGFGSMFKYMKSQYPEFHFTGFDISEAMITEAKKLFPAGRWESKTPVDMHDYVVASGIFNVRLENNDKDWEQYIFDTLGTMNALSSKGFSFNVLTKYSDKEFMRDYLFYADPMKIFDHCKTKYSKFVSVLHDYPLYEFTVIVRKF